MNKLASIILNWIGGGKTPIPIRFLKSVDIPGNAPNTGNNYPELNVIVDTTSMVPADDNILTDLTIINAPYIIYKSPFNNKEYFYVRIQDDKSDDIFTWFNTNLGENNNIERLYAIFAEDAYIGDDALYSGGQFYAVAKLDDGKVYLLYMEV